MKPIPETSMFLASNGVPVGWNVEFTYACTPSFNDGFKIFLSGEAYYKDGSCAVWINYDKSLGRPTGLRRSPDALIARERGSHIFDALSKTNIRAAPPYVMGCDGAMYTLTLNSGLDKSTFEWWNELPDGWEALAPSVELLIELAKELGASVDE